MKSPRTAPDTANEMANGLTLTLPVPPSANRWWRKFRNRMVLSAEARAYKQMVALLVRGPMPFPTENVCVTIRWVRARKAGDLDKRAPILLDALQGVAYMNDSQIVELHAYRSDGTEPRVDVEVRAA